MPNFSLFISSYLFFSICHLFTWSSGLASLVAQTVKNQPAMRETCVPSLGWEDPLEEGMATHSSNLAWRIPWTEEPGRLQSIASQRFRHDWNGWAHTHACMHTEPGTQELFSAFLFCQKPIGFAFDPSHLHSIMKVQRFAWNWWSLPLFAGRVRNWANQARAILLS